MAFSRTWHGGSTTSGFVCRLTIWIQTALKLQGQLVGVIAANPRFVSAWNEWKAKNEKHTRGNCMLGGLFSLTTGDWWSDETQPTAVLPAARMNWPSLDTLIEVHTVGISKSWMSSILRWMSGGEFNQMSEYYIHSSPHVEDNSLAYDAVIVVLDSPTSFFCNCLFFRSDSHCV